MEEGMLDQVGDWDDFTGRVRVIHPRFSVTVGVEKGLVVKTIPKLKRIPVGEPLEDVFAWYHRHKHLAIELMRGSPHARRVNSYRQVMGRYSGVDRSCWDSGPWDIEVDFSLWEYRRMPCVLFRNSYGAWCGYVGVSCGNSLYGKSYNDIDQIAVHGGLTFTGKKPYAVNKVYSILKEEPPKLTWWIGFDCAHAFDDTPVKPNASIRGKSDYVTIDTARYFVHQLADQVPCALLRLVSSR